MMSRDFFYLKKLVSLSSSSTLYLTTSKLWAY